MPSCPSFHRQDLPSNSDRSGKKSRELRETLHTFALIGESFEEDCGLTAGHVLCPCRGQVEVAGYGPRPALGDQRARR